MQDTQEIKPIKLNLDKTPKALNENESPFMLNNNIEVNGVGEELSVSTPHAANFPACEMEMVSGANHNTGRYYSPITNEEYSWTWNENGGHFISRIKSDGTCEVVYDEQCLQLSPNPKNEITEWRVTMKVVKQCSKVPNGELKQLIWVDGSDNPIFCLDVETSIATNSFTTNFFETDNPCEYIQLCVPKPDKCLNGTIRDTQGVNRLRGAFKFMYSWVYYDGRESEYSDVSSLYFVELNDDCFGVRGKCIDFDIPMGNAMVEYINIAVSQDNGKTWYLYEQVPKYRRYKNANELWYERERNEELVVNLGDNTFKYSFCNDKMKTPLPDTVMRAYNPIPIAPQGILNIKNTIGYYNYEKGVCPISKEETDKFKVHLNCQEESTCVSKTVKVKVRAIVYSFFYNNHSNDPRGYVFKTKSGQIAFGKGLDEGSNDQVFLESKNFQVYIDGTPYVKEMKQYKSTPYLTDYFEVEVAESYPGWIVGQGFYFQEAEFEVPKGTKGFLRMASHRTPADQNKSTQVKGIISDLSTYQGNSGLNGLDINTKEIYFDTCNVDNELVIPSAFVVEDFYGKFTNKQLASYSGYIYDVDKQPVQGARIYRGNDFNAITDFNGYYAFYIADGNSVPIELSVRGEKSCTEFGVLGTFRTESDKGEMGYKDFEIKDVNYQKALQDVVVKIKDCNNNAIEGVRVAISGGKYRTSDETGTVTFKVRNNFTRNKKVRAVAMGNCFKLDCQDNCNPCMPSIEGNLPQCFNSNPPFELGSMILNPVFSSAKGLKKGGKYPFGFVVEGRCGRISAVYETGAIDIPKSGNCSFYFEGNQILLPDWADRLKIVRGANLNNFRLQWVVDEIEYTPNGIAKLTIQSLNDYNTQYNFKTNLSYEYVEGDWVRFVRNADGSPLPENLEYAIISPFKKEIKQSEDTSGTNFFNQIGVRDNGKLSSIKKGAIIEINGTKPKQDEPTFFEICASIPVENGRLIAETGTFNTFDTFIVQRQIGSFAVREFEHHSPSDFALPNMDDTGRVHFINKYETLKRYGRNVTLSSPNKINYFDGKEVTLKGEEQGDIVFMGLLSTHGIAICENGNVPFDVNDNFLRVDNAGNVVAAPPDAIIGQPRISAGSFFGCRYEDIGSICQADGVVTFVDNRRGLFIVHNYQSASEAGLHQSDSGIGTYCSSYFKRRCREKDGINTGEDFTQSLRWVTGYNPLNNIIFLTIKRWSDSGIRNGKAAHGENETIAYNPIKDEFPTFLSFTPEGYSMLNLQTEEGCAFITYQNALPFIHPIKSETFNSFYEVPCDWIIEAVFNKHETKRKIPLALEMISDKMFYAKEITTDVEGEWSEIPPKIVEEMQSGKWNTEVLNNINSRGGLHNGNKLNGYFIKVTLVRDNTRNLVYGTVDTEKQMDYGRFDRVLLKFMFSEQSGFTNNK